jgi:hypothetical protein
MGKQASDRINKIIAILVVILMIAMVVSMMGPLWLR